MSTRTLMLIIALALSISGFAYTSLRAPSSADEYRQAGPPAPRNAHALEVLVIKTKDGKEHVFDIEVARNPDQLAYGLMNRTSMPENHGMLFMFPSENERAFWMKNTLIPLDMLFIRADGTIHRIHDSAIPHDPTPINSRGPVLAVLELNGGRAAELGIKVGDVLLYKDFRR